jgi:hypothetical protein
VTKVVVAFCHPADRIAPQFRRSLTAVQVRDAVRSRRIVDELDHESSANISAARNGIVEAFLGHGLKPEWLWMLDADMTFADNILDRLLETANPSERPIVGGLCFSVRPRKMNGREYMNPVGATALELFPTIYRFRDGRLHQFYAYRPGEVERVDSTGAACLLVHRRVFEDRRWQDGHPFPWFRESVLEGMPCSEDQFFCLKAGSLGYPIFVDTRARTGHVKTFIADEDAYLAQRAMEAARLEAPV